MGLRAKTLVGGGTPVNAKTATLDKTATKVSFLVSSYKKLAQTWYEIKCYRCTIASCEITSVGYTKNSPIKSKHLRSC